MNVDKYLSNIDAYNLAMSQSVSSVKKFKLTSIKKEVSSQKCLISLLIELCTALFILKNFHHFFNHNWKAFLQSLKFPQNNLANMLCLSDSFRNSKFYQTVLISKFIYQSSFLESCNGYFRQSGKMQYSTASLNVKEIKSVILSFVCLTITTP